MNFARFERLSDVCLVEGNGEIQTLATCCSNQPFAKGVRLRRFIRRLQNSQPQCFEERIQVFTIRDHKPVSFVAGEAFP
jgi:hypothetical protein